MLFIIVLLNLVLLLISSATPHRQPQSFWIEFSAYLQPTQNQQQSYPSHPSFAHNQRYYGQQGYDQTKFVHNQQGYHQLSYSGTKQPIRENNYDKIYYGPYVPDYHYLPVPTSGIMKKPSSQNPYQGSYQETYPSMMRNPFTSGPFVSGPITSEMQENTDRQNQPQSQGGADRPITFNQQGPQQVVTGTNLIGSQTQNANESLNIQVPFYRSTFQNSTSLKKCGEYFRIVQLMKGRHTPIVGGAPSNPKQFPHMALLGYGDPNDIQWLCGGSLISEQYVLTAAHCTFAQGLGRVRYIRLGELDLNSTTEDADVKDFLVSEIIPHPLYTALASYHDIAIIRMNATVSVTPYTRPVCLAATRFFNDALLVIAGWGLTEEGGAPATILQRTTLKEVSNERCRAIYGKPRNLKDGILEEIQICADGGKERRDTCHGDSGGPLQYTNYEYNEPGLLGFTEVVGVTSFGKGCGLTAGVYTRVLPYVQWIEKIVWPNE